MKVLHINTYDTGGAAVAMIRLHNALLHKGVSSSILTRQKTRNDLLHHHAHNANLGLLERIKRRFNGKRGIRGRQLDELAKRSKGYEIYTFAETEFDVPENKCVVDADVICLHWIADFVDYSSFFSSIKQPMVWVFHDMNAFLGGFHYHLDHLQFNAEFSALETQINTIKDNALVRRSNLTVVSPSDWLLNASKATERFKDKPHFCIRNCGDPKNFTIIDRKEAKAKLHLDPDKNYLLAIASNLNTARKGIKFLVEAISQSTNLPYQFILIGQPMEAIAQNENVISTGVISDLDELNMYYSCAEAVILPSIEDNLPNVMLESLLAGTPIIAFKTHGMQEIIEDKKTGILTEDQTGKGLHEAIKRFHQTAFDDEQFDRTKLRETALSKFDPATQAEKYLDIFQSMTNNQ